MFLFLLAGTRRSCKHSCLSPFVSITNENTVQRHARGLMVPRHTALITKYCSSVYTHKDTYKPSEVFSKKLSKLTRMFTPGSAGSLLLLLALPVFSLELTSTISVCLTGWPASACVADTSSEFSADVYVLVVFIIWMLRKANVSQLSFKWTVFFTVFRGNKNAQATS